MPRGRGYSAPGSSAASGSGCIERETGLPFPIGQALLNGKPIAALSELAYQMLIKVATAQGHNARKSRELADHWMAGYEQRRRILEART